MVLTDCDEHEQRRDAECQRVTIVTEAVDFTWMEEQGRSIVIETRKARLLRRSGVRRVENNDPQLIAK